MMVIRFVEGVEVEDHNRVVIQSFTAGEVVEMNRNSARYWMNRQCATEVMGADLSAFRAKQAPVKPVGVPASLRPTSGGAHKFVGRPKGKAGK